MEKDIYILGISQSHNATAALLKNGEIIGCISEERFTRIKNHQGYPKKSVEYLLQENKIKGDDLNLVVLNFKSAIHFATEKTKGKISWLYGIITWLTFKIPFLNFLYDATYSLYKNTINKGWYEEQIDKISRELGIEKSKIISFEHHLTHAASVIYSLGLNNKEKVLVITNDGAGDYYCQSISVYENNKFKMLSKTGNEHSLAGFYGCITTYLGMKINEHEYKVMGLAPYTNPDQKGVRDTSEIFDKIFSIQGLSIRSSVDAKHYLFFLDKVLKRKRFDWIAYSAQKLVEQNLCQLVKNAIEKTGIKKVACAGGIFMNVKANKCISELDSVEKFYVMPSSADESTAIGAAYLGWVTLSKRKGISSIDTVPLKDLYLGNKVANEEIVEYIEKNKLREEFNIEYFEDPEKEVASMITRGKIVARFSGRMEFGQRALGNRSILANPSQKDVIQEINDQIKSRDFWMPFAGSILEEYESEYINNPKRLEAYYMILSFDSTERAKREIFAASHPYDKTIRPQIVKKEMNPKYHYLISCFRELTGIGAVLNTSLNLHGEPIVCSIEDAIHTLRDSGLKYMQIENYIFSKRI